jgi:anti-sigma factor RsiW
MQCEDLMRYLSDYIDHNLDDDLAAAAREHLATCQNCRVVLDSTQRTILLYREHGQAQTIPLGRQQRLFEHVKAAFDKRGEN